MKLLEYYSSCLLECATQIPACSGAEQPGLILCLSHLLTANNAPYIDATLVSTVKKPCNSRCTFLYTIQYDENLLLNPNTFLTQTDITSVLCRDCLTEYIDSRINAIALPAQAAECPSNYFVGA